MSLFTGRFFAFLALVCAAYYLAPRRWQNALLLLAGLAYAAAAGPWTVGVLCAQIAVAYAAGRGLERLAGRARKALLAAGTALLLGELLTFKYADLLTGRATALGQLAVLGISFYTLMAVGYLADVYRGTVPAEHSLLRFALFLSFFPQLSSGPIGRAGELLPQFGAPRAFDYDRFARGTTNMLWGYFKKCVLADGLGLAVDPVFHEPAAFSGPALVLAAALFSLQLYLDFSGYTDIARGMGQVFGIELRQNFAHPFGAHSFAALWGRWHMSLSQWFRDYVYIPLGGSRRGTVRMCAATMAVFALSGLWHRAGWIFLWWGVLNGVCNLLDKCTAPARARLAARVPGYAGSRWQVLWQRVWVFTVFSLCFILFRVGENAGATAADCLYYYRHLFTGWDVLLAPGRLVAQLRAMSIGRKFLAYMGVSALVYNGVEHAAIRAGTDAAGWLRARRPAARVALYYLLALLILCFGQLGTSSFIYFQF